MRVWHWITVIVLTIGVGITPLSAQTDCPTDFATRLPVGFSGTARVLPGATTRIRQQPTTAAAIVGEMPGDTEFEILAGPQCGDGYVWWQIDYDGVIGWTAEGSGGYYWIMTPQPYPGALAFVDAAAAVRTTVTPDVTTRTSPDGVWEAALEQYACTGEDVLDTLTMQRLKEEMGIPPMQPYPIGLGRLIVTDSATGLRREIADELLYCDTATPFSFRVDTWSDDSTLLYYTDELAGGGTAAVPLPARDSMFQYNVTTGEVVYLPLAEFSPDGVWLISAAEAIRLVTVNDGQMIDIPALPVLNDLEDTIVWDIMWTAGGITYTQYYQLESPAHGATEPLAVTHLDLETLEQTIVSGS